MAVDFILVDTRLKNVSETLKGLIFSSRLQPSLLSITLGDFTTEWSTMTPESTRSNYQNL